MSEISILQKRDTAPGAGHMEFVDIADDSFDPAAHGGVAYKSAMSTMYGALWGARLAPILHAHTHRCAIPSGLGDPLLLGPDL